MPNIRKTIAVNLKRTRTRAHMTQTRLAQLIRVDSSYIVHLEKGDKNVTVDVVEKLARALRVRTIALLS